MITMKTHALLALGFLSTICSIAASQDARQILEASGVQGGLVVVIGCDSPELLEELRAGARTRSTLWIASRKDGAKQEACPLPTQPILDGMALTD